MGVAIDTFIVRTILVPAVVTMIGTGGFTITLCGKPHRVDPNWWPTQMPDPLLTTEEEEAALWAGYAIPPSPEALRKDPDSVKLLDQQAQNGPQKQQQLIEEGNADGVAADGNVLSA
jgi:hypothetical protein